jgi:hypothetical protein
MPKLRGHIRRSQLITTYGVGAIVPVGDEAFMVAGLRSWDVPAPDLHEPRLERDMRVRGFVQPPATDDRPDVPVVRFPVWQSCPVCRRLARHGDFTHFDLNDCPDCSQPLVPSRFVIACERGHIDDFPYERWVHHGRPSEGTRHELTLSSTGTTASLAGIVISCACGAQRTLEDAFDRYALRDVTKCRGRRPWATFDLEDCDEVPRTLQRGASSVWFGHTRSALSIPPWSESASRALDSHWPTLRHLPIEALPPIIASMKLVEKTGFSEDELLVIAQARKREEAGDPSGDSGLRREEYDALVRGRPESPTDTDFATRSAEVPSTLRALIAQLQLATRLREVRALAGFSRIFPPRGVEGEKSNIVSIYDEDVDWLPAIEVKGEGIFIRLDNEALASWSVKPSVRERVGVLAERDRLRHERWGMTPERATTGTFLLLHVFAHALINQLALDAGYPAGSLRERIYADEAAAGLLIYTATSDSAGSLGGLISRGAQETFERTVREAVARFAWCSADPICIESEAAGVESLNLAACHSCALLPETSCEEANMFLDRALLVGTTEEPAIGFFSDLLP